MLSFESRLLAKSFIKNYSNLSLLSWLKLFWSDFKEIGFIYLNKKQFYLNNKSNFLFQFDEIFNKQIYFFKSDTKKIKIIDCGSNIGLSVLYFKWLYPKSSIIAFEPNPKTFQILSKNISRSQEKDILLIPKALWSFKKIVRFNADLYDASAIADLEDQHSEFVNVETTSLRPYLQEPVDFLKLDIEGAETEVLNDISQDLHRVKHLFVEYHSYANQDQTLHEILEIITQAGFRYYMERTGVYQSQPYLDKLELGSEVDLQLNIFAYRSLKI
ncbi:MAG: FkbM family methyltransferase [Cytophagales bacterium]|nr:MAG: FkbM family methyltransferase [Cytophagales bacterium]TAF60936.1 MAG: FkbM family methyltransferase [Cytophagales bacterium]